MNRIRIIFVLFLIANVQSIAIANDSSNFNTCKDSQVQRLVEEISIQQNNEDRLQNEQFKQIQSEMLVAVIELFEKLEFADVSGEKILLLYNTLGNWSGYETEVVRDLVKRYLLAWARESIISVEERAEIQELIQQTELDTKKLMTLFETLNENDTLPLPSEQEIKKRIDRLVRLYDIDIKDENTIELVRVIGLACHYADVSHWGEVINSRRRSRNMSYLSLIENPDPVSALIQILITESIRTVHFEGSIHFLELDGRIEELNPLDVRAFEKRLPYQEAKKYSYWPLGINALGLMHIKLYIGDDIRDFSNKPDWLMTIFTDSKVVP